MRGSFHRTGNRIHVQYPSTFLAFGLHKLLFEFNPLRRATSVLKQTISIPQLKSKFLFQAFFLLVQVRDGPQVTVCLRLVF